MRLVSLRLAIQFLRGHYGRLALTVIAIGCAVAQVSANDMIGSAVLSAFVDIIDTVAGRAALQISAGEGALFAADAVGDVAHVPGVERMVPILSTTAFTTDESGELLGVQALDLSDDAAVRVYELRDVEGEGLSDPKILLPDSIVLTHSFADRHQLRVGSPLELDTPHGRHAFTVRALLDPAGIARMYQGNLILMDLQSAQALFAEPGLVNRVDVVVQRDSELQAVAQAIAARLPAGLQVATPEQRKADLHNVIHSMQLLLSALDVIGLSAAFLIAFNGLSTMFERRAWLIGILRGIGVRSKAIWRELVHEALILAIAGTVIGVPMGVGMGRLLLPAITTAVSLESQVDAPPTSLGVRLSSLALGGILGALAAVCAALLPAWRASRTSIVRTMRERGLEQHGMASAGRVWLRVALAAAVIAAIALHAHARTPAMGLVATALIVVAVALSARPLVDALGTRFRLGLREGPVATFVAAHIARTPRRSALTVAMIGVGLGAVLWLWMVAESFEASVISVLTQAMRADLVVSSTHIQSGFLEAPVDDALATDLQRIPGVKAVAGDRVADWHYGGGAIALDAFDPVYFTDTTFGEWPLFGRRLPRVWSAVARGEAVVASSNFLQNLHMGVGDAITLDAPAGPLHLRIAGVVTHFTSPRGTLIMSRDVYRQYWHDSRVTRVFVQTQPETDTATLRAAIARQFGKSYGVQVVSCAELIEYFASQVRRAFAGLYVLAGLVLFIVVVGVMDTLVAGVVERTREIGAIRVVGVRRRNVRQMILGEALVLGTLGVLLAVACGLALGMLWVEITFPSLFGWVIELHLPYGHAVRTAVLAIAACLIAAYFPARHAAELEPVAALRYE